MIVCSCNVITDADIEQALVEIMHSPTPPLPTPGIVWKHLSARMKCCGCAPLAVETIYAKMEKLEREGEICPHLGRAMRGQLIRLKNARMRARRASSSNAASAALVAAE